MWHIQPDHKAGVNSHQTSTRPAQEKRLNSDSQLRFYLASEVPAAGLRSALFLTNTDSYSTTCLWGAFHKTACHNIS